jgi:hypothetical protein
VGPKDSKGTGCAAGSRKDAPVLACAEPFPLSIDVHQAQLGLAPHAKEVGLYQRQRFAKLGGQMRLNGEYRLASAQVGPTVSAELEEVLRKARWPQTIPDKRIDSLVIVSRVEPNNSRRIKARFSRAVPCLGARDGDNKHQKSRPVSASPFHFRRWGRIACA